MLELDTILVPNFIRAWELDLQHNLTDIQHSTILHLTHISSISSKLAEVNYKMLSRCTWSQLISMIFSLMCLLYAEEAVVSLLLMFTYGGNAL